MDVIWLILALAAGLAAGLCALIAASILTWRVVKRSQGNDEMKHISTAIRIGAMAYLKRQYKVLIVFIAVMAVILLLGIGWRTSVAFLVGAIFSALAGFVGMNVATKANARTTEAARQSLNDGLRVAFSSGAVMGLTVVGLGLCGVTSLYLLFSYLQVGGPAVVIESIVGFSLGASSVALFARVGGGIFTKAADVGADLVGKVEAGIPEDDPRNPAVIADNVGDNVGDVAGMGADLYESYVGAIIASMVLGVAAFKGIEGALLPLLVAGSGIIASIIGTFLVRTKETVEQGVLLAALRRGIFATAILVIIFAYIITVTMLGMENIGVFYGVFAGVIAGLLLGIFTEYYTSDKYKPTRKLAEASQTGAGTTIINGFAVGMQSSALPMVTLGVAILASYYLASTFTSSNADPTLIGLYGVALSGVGMLSTLGITLASDAYGPVADNAGGIAQMANLDPEVRERTDALDALGNTTAATGKGFAIGSAALTALALIAAYTQTVQRELGETLIINITEPKILVGLFLGGMLPFLFCSLTMKAVGRTADLIVREVRRQFKAIPGLMGGTGKPDYARCVDISTKGAQREMIVPSLMAVIAPLVVGFILGPQALAALLVGALVTGFLLAVTMANSGGAWDNAKKFIEKGNLGGKGSDTHKAAVIGDTVGDPFKDTSGPSLNILLKLMSVVSLVFAALIVKYNLIVWFGGL